MTELPPEVTILDRDDVARILKASPSTITRLHQRGELVGFRTGEQGGLIRWTLADVIAYVDRKRAEGRAVVQRLPTNPHHARRNLRPVVDGAEPWDAA